MLRKIETKEQKERSDEKKRKIIVIVLAVIMLGSTFAYLASEFFSKSENSITYRGIKFEQNENGYWIFSTNQQTYQTYYNPLETQNVSLNLTKAIADYSGKAVYFGIINNEMPAGEAVQEIGRSLGNVFEKINFACVGECSLDYPEKECSKEIIILFKEANNSIVSLDEKCIIIEYAPGELGKATDAFLFRLLGLQ